MMTNVVTKQKTALHLAAGLMLGLAIGMAQANPTNPQVVSGTAQFAEEGNVLTAPSPNTTPLGLIRNIRPLDVNCPNICDGFMSATRFSTVDCALCC